MNPRHRTYRPAASLMLGIIRRRRPQCCHRWLLEMPNGVTSTGVCRSCGRSRSFLNAFEDIMDAQHRARIQQLA